MSNNNGSRVLTRVGARELTSEEIQKVTGSGDRLITLASVLITGGPGGYDEKLDT